MSDRQVLFLMGPGRSGTTALTDLLNAHPKVAIGMERYKSLWRERIDEIQPDFFERERFFDFSDGLTNITPQGASRWGAMYTQLAAKWDDVTVVGDKMTRIRIEELMRTFPDAKFLCIVRDPVKVAASWQARADNASDHWSAGADARASVDTGNRVLRRIRRARRQHPDKVAVVRYRPMFGDPEGTTLRKVLDFVGLDPAPELDAAYARIHRQFVETIRDRETSLPQEHLDYIRDHVDWDAWRALGRLSL